MGRILKTVVCRSASSVRAGNGPSAVKGVLALSRSRSLEQGSPGRKRKQSDAADPAPPAKVSRTFPYQIGEKVLVAWKDELRSGIIKAIKPRKKEAQVTYDDGISLWEVYDPLLKGLVTSNKSEN